MASCTATRIVTPALCRLARQEQRFGWVCGILPPNLFTRDARSRGSEERPFTCSARSRGSMLQFILAAAMLMDLPSYAQKERDADSAQQAVQAEASGGLTPEEAAALARPKNMPNLLKGDKIPAGKDGVPTWNVGPTGIIGLRNAGMGGDQVQVAGILPGSPAEGKFLPGDVILGVQGKDFVVGGHLGVTIGNAIIKAEEEAGKGVMKFHIWRDRNWAKRAAGKDMLGVDIDKLLKQTENESNDYEWMGEKERKADVAQAVKSEVPIDGFHTNLTLQLKVMGTYSETSPWDCPVATRIREDAWKVLEAAFKPDKKGRTSGGSWRDAIALIASGKPEHRELVRNWVHKQKLCKDINEKVEFVGGSYLSWRKSFGPLDMAIYYDATGDDYVLPEIRKTAIEVAMGQSGGGSWGHTFSSPMFNGGQLHGRCPGYGAMNNAGTRCFFLLTLARKAGIKDPEIDAAIWRASRFFGTYVDKGCIPYGDHGPHPSDDSNGKNYGAAYAFYTLGMSYQAKYFSMHSAHASFTSRGGHGSPDLWQFTPLSSHISGQKAVTAAMRNMRWFYTVARRHDGSFVIQSEQAGIGSKTSESPTALYAMYHSLPLKQLITTGKDANTNCWMNDKEYEQLLISARNQMNDPVLLERSGKPWNERSTDELIGWMGHFYPNMRRGIAAELGKRFKAGETAIVPKVTALLESQDARVRDGACLSIVACGTDSTLGTLSKLTRLLDDPAEFVRMSAINAIASTSQPGDRSREEMLLKKACEEYPAMSTDIANMRTAVKNNLLAKGSKLCTDPFSAGYDKELVRLGLERIITMDPGGVAMQTWTRETMAELAGPIVFIADELPIMDKMSGGARLAAGRAILAKNGYREAAECDVVNLLRRSALPRGMRRDVTFVHGRATYGLLTPASVMARPGAYRPYLAHLKQWLHDDPLAAGLDILIRQIEEDKKASELPSLGAEAVKLFEKDFASKGGTAEKTKFCRDVLKDTSRKDFFRQMAAMTQLAAMVGPEAAGDIAPYLAVHQWRVREHASKRMLDLAKSGASGRLVELFTKAEGANAAALLMALADSGAKEALATARAALKHKDDIVRKAAVQAVMATGGDKAVQEVLAFMASAADVQELWGCELALLSRKDDAAFVKQVRDGAIAMMPKATVAQRRSLAYVMGQLGGAESLTALQKAAATAKDDKDLDAIIEALSYSPDRAADKVLVDLAKQEKQILEAVVAQSVRRMVGPNGVGDVTDSQRLDFAEPILRMMHDGRLISYLGKIHTGRSLQLLVEVMKSGSAPLAAKVIISAVDGMEKQPEAERAIAADALIGVIEYVEVTKLRGGFAAHTKDGDDYVGWKSFQAQAGKAMLKFHKPKAAPIPTFNEKDLDL